MHLEANTKKQRVLALEKELDKVSEGKISKIEITTELTRILDELEGKGIRYMTERQDLAELYKLKDYRE